MIRLVSEVLQEQLWDAMLLGPSERAVALYGACQLGGVDCVNKKRDGVAMIHVACEVGDVELLNMLISFGADIEARDKEGCTPLHLAAYWGKVDNLQFLLAKGASVTAKDKDGWTALHHAARCGKVKPLELLQAQRAALDPGDKDGDTPLHISAMEGKVKFVKALLEAGARADSHNNTNWSPLHVAANKGHADIVRIILAAGAKPNAKTADSWTALHCAARKGHADVVAALKECGADLAIRNNDGKTPYEVAPKAAAALRNMLRDPTFSKQAAGASAGGGGGSGGGSGGGGGGSGGNGGGGKGGGCKAPAPKAAAGSATAVDAALASWLARVGIAEHVLPVCTSLGLAKLPDVHHVLESDLLGVGVPPVARRKFVEAAALVPHLAPVGSGMPQASARKAFAPLPFPDFTKVSSAAFDGHAEKLAASFMRWLGYGDAQTNGGVHTPDRGIDVVSKKGVAQVKANFRSTVKRAALAQLVGDASVERFKTKDLLFFAVSYAPDATSFAQEQAGRPIMLFTFDSDGVVKPHNAAAQKRCQAA